MFKPSLFAVALLATTEAAQAQQPPGAGTQLQQLPQRQKAVKPGPDLEFQRPVAPVDLVGGPAIIFRSLRIDGQTLFSEADLFEASGFAAGSTLTYGQLRQLAGRVSDYYHARGYFLAQAYLPEQDVQNGTVRITVIEGRYGAITLTKVAGLAPGTATNILHGLEPNATIAMLPLERRLLLLSDLPGIRTRATLSPGVVVGTSDLRVDLSAGPRVSGNIEADNAGSRYTGDYRFGGTVYLNNPTGRGDQLSLRALASDRGLAYGRIAYQAPVGAFTSGVAYAHLRYSLGREFAALDGSGTADILSGYASYPLVRSRRANLYALGNFDYRFLRDDIGIVSSRSRKHIVAGTLGLSGNMESGGGNTVFAVGATLGNLDIRSAPERFIDATTARSAGRYGKLQSSIARTQAISGPFSIYGAVRGQLAFANLDSSEKIELGGAYGVRAYPEGEAFGDTGYIATAEVRARIGRQTGKLPGAFDLIGFIDTGAVRYAHSPWFAGANRAVRSGYGAGLNWYGPEGIIIRGTYARKLGTGPATSAPDRDGRFWFQIVKLF